MVAAFLALGGGLIAHGGFVARVGGWQNSAIGATLAAAGLALIVAGLAPTDPGAATTAETVHSRASALATLAVIGAALLSSWPPAAAHRGLLWLAVIAAGLGVLSVLLHDTGAAGLGQRMLWAVLVAWLLLAAGHMRPVKAEPGRSRTSSESGRPRT